MNAFSEFIDGLLTMCSDYRGYFIALGALCVSILLLGLIGRFACGKKSVMHGSVSAVIGILFVYALFITIHSAGLKLRYVLSPLPFISLDGDILYLHSLAGFDYIGICADVLNMVILAFTVNLIDSWMPKGKRLIHWFIFRGLSVVLGILVFTLLIGVLNYYLPEGLMTWAPVILLSILLLSLALGALKGVVGAIIATANPLLAVLYTFFFASVLGKMVTKALLTTLIMGSMVYILNYFGIAMFSIGLNALIAFIPMMLVLLLLWYLIGKVWMK